MNKNIIIALALAVFLTPTISFASPTTRFAHQLGLYYCSIATDPVQIASCNHYNLPVPAEEPKQEVARTPFVGGIVWGDQLTGINDAQNKLAHCNRWVLENGVETEHYTNCVLTGGEKYDKYMKVFKALNLSDETITLLIKVLS